MEDADRLNTSKDSILIRGGFRAPPFTPRRGGATRPLKAWRPARAGKQPAPHARAQSAAARNTRRARMAAVAAGSGTPREEEGPGGEVAASQPQAPTSGPGARLSRLPLARVKALVKADPDVTLAGQEAIFVLARAAVRREREGSREGERVARVRGGASSGRDLLRPRKQGLLWPCS